jgi:hypothetical protein
MISGEWQKDGDGLEQGKVLGEEWYEHQFNQATPYL